MTHAQLPAVTGLAARCPDVTIVLDHLGKPDVAGGRLDPWRADLARSPRGRTSSASSRASRPRPTTRAWTPADLRPYLAHALDVLRRRTRCLVGSDWPVATLATTYERWFDVVLEFLADVPAPEREAILSGNAARVYGCAR